MGRKSKIVYCCKDSRRETVQPGQSRPLTGVGLRMSSPSRERREWQKLNWLDNQLDVLAWLSKLSTLSLGRITAVICAVRSKQRDSYVYELTVKYFSNQVDMGSISRLLLVLVSSLTGCLSSSDIEPTLVSVSLGSKVSLSCDQDRAQWTLTNNGTTLTIEGRNIKMLR